MDFNYAISIDPYHEKEFLSYTHFIQTNCFQVDRYELRLLFGLVGGEEEISIDDIITLLRADEHIKHLLEYLFETLGSVQNGVMAVAEFIKAMSIISRGSKMQRLELVFRLCDQDHDNIVDREELVQLAKLAEELLRRYNFGYGNVATPEEAAYEIFGIEGEPKAVQKLRKKDFMARAELDPDMYHQ